MVQNNNIQEKNVEKKEQLLITSKLLQLPICFHLYSKATWNLYVKREIL